MKLNIKKVDVKSVNVKATSQELLQAGCCCGNPTEIRPVFSENSFKK